MASKFQPVRGMRDFLPETAKKKQFIEDACRQVFESFGFEPLSTPVVEDLGLLTEKGGGGDAIRDEIYWFKDKGEREVGLRFDLTVPLGRVMASNPQLPKPFKRCQIGTVYRYDRPQAKRYREFTQADVDIAGAGTMTADFEIVSLAASLMQKLGLSFVIRINSRPVLEQLAQKCGVKKEQVSDCFRLIDKKDKMDWKTIEKELKEKGIDPKIAKVISQNKETEIRELLRDSSELKQLTELFSLAKATGIEKFIRLDFALARGLDYYTGIVFEVVAENTTVAAGGRYDRLVELYGGPATSCVGISFGVDRLLDLLEEKLNPVSKTRVLLVALDPKQNAYAFRVAGEIRKSGLNCEMDLLNRSLSKNIETATKKGIPFLAIVGENEEKTKSVSVKNLRTQKQQLVPLADLASFWAKSD